MDGYLLLIIETKNHEKKFMEIEKRENFPTRNKRKDYKRSWMMRRGERESVDGW